MTGVTAGGRLCLESGGHAALRLLCRFARLHPQLDLQDETGPNVKHSGLFEFSVKAP